MLTCIHCLDNKVSQWVYVVYSFIIKELSLWL